MLLGFDRWKLLLLFLTDSCDLCSMHCTFLLLELRYGLLHGQVSCSFSLNPDFGVCLCNSKDFFWRRDIVLDVDRREAIDQDEDQVP